MSTDESPDIRLRNRLGIADAERVAQGKLPGPQSAQSRLSILTVSGMLTSRHFGRLLTEK